MKYDFDTLLDRTGFDALAAEEIPVKGAEIKPGFSRIPMWIADMNFVGAPSVQEELMKRAAHPAFGYFSPSDAYYGAIIKWQETRNGVSCLEKKHIGYENGVLGGVVTALNVMCSRGDRVLVNSPTYIGFRFALGGCGYRLTESPLRRDAGGVWRMDYDDMEKKIRENNIHAAVFCSPHNPTGRVWEPEEIRRAMEIFKKYDVYVVSDEIWSDLTLEGYRHTPTQSVSEDARRRTAAFYAPSKTFNLAGLVGSYHIVYNDWLRERMNREASISCYNHMNVLSMHALVGAYGGGAEWLDELRGVLTKNVDFACGCIEKNFGGVSLARPQGTYMLFLDCEKWCRSRGKTLDELLKAGVAVGVVWQDGRPFGGEWTIRMNLALPFTAVREAFERLGKYVFSAGD